MTYCPAKMSHLMGLPNRLTLAINHLALRTILLLSSMDDNPIGEVVENTHTGSQAEYILNTYGNSLLRYAYSYLHNMSDAEDVLQETLIRFLKSAPVFESHQHEKAWLMLVAGNLSKNRIEYNALRRTDELAEDLAAQSRSDLSFVWDAVKSLPSNYRAVVHLFYHEGYSTKEIADILQKNESTVRSDLRRGRLRLKEILKKEYDFE